MWSPAPTTWSLVSKVWSPVTFFGAFLVHAKCVHQDLKTGLRRFVVGLPGFGLGIAVLRLGFVAERNAPLLVTEACFSYCGAQPRQHGAWFPMCEAQLMFSDGKIGLHNFNAGLHGSAALKYPPLAGTQTAQDFRQMATFEHVFVQRSFFKIPNEMKLGTRPIRTLIRSLVLKLRSSIPTTWSLVTKV